MYKLVFFVPESHLAAVKGAVFAAGAGRLGNYDMCCWQTSGQGQFRPLEGSDPFIGREGELTVVNEYRVEVICADERLSAALSALRQAHPYEDRLLMSGASKILADQELVAMSDFWQKMASVLAPLTADAEPGFQGARPAAVLVLLSNSPKPEVIYTLRAKHLSHHAGEVCFPGGMWETHDPSLLATALRETHEEIGLHPSLVQVLGSLPRRQTRSGTWVQPFVGRIPADCKFELNPHELDELFTVPLAEFAHGLHVRTDLFERNGVRVRMPVYQYQKYEIWGFTALVTADLLTRLNAAVEDPLQSR